MKAIGTRTARIQCQVCKRLSPKFTLYLIEDDTKKEWGLAATWPTGWRAEDKSEIVRDMMYGVIVHGLCKVHK